MQQKPMDYLLINPSAGSSQDADFWSQQLEAHGVRPKVCDSGDYEALPELKEHDRLLVAGGDGTVSRYAAWCADRGCILGILPGGTGNDFARGLEIPLEAEAACATIANGIVREVDIAWVDDRRFLNVAHIGLGSEISMQAQQQTKQWWGRFSYAKTLLAKIERRRGFKAIIECDGQRRRGRWLEIAVANGRSFGGGHEVFEAAVDDGELNVIAIRPRSLWHLFKVWTIAQLRGATPDDRAIVKMRGANIKVTGGSAKTVSADGEHVGSVPVRFNVEHRALRVITPVMHNAMEDAA